MTDPTLTATDVSYRGIDDKSSRTNPLRRTENSDVLPSNTKQIDNNNNEY